MNILLTGGIGYIGRHIAAVLIGRGHSLTIVDNLSTSCIGDVLRLESALGHPVNFINSDVRDVAVIRRVISEHSIQCVIHLAAFKILSESILRPIEYYDNNVGGLVALLKAMNSEGCKSIVFSSSAAVYAQNKYQPLGEDSKIDFGSPYASSKLIGEKLLNDLLASDSDWRVGILRYFNPVGSYENGLLGEGIGNHLTNLVPSIMRVALGQSDYLKIYGDNFPTPDGTGIRDYIHVMDLAEGHLASIDALFTKGSHTVNLGAGIGYSVLEVINKFQEISGHNISYKVVNRRAGDLPIAYASVEKAYNSLGWEARQSSLENICKSILGELLQLGN
jgi:UDP-glucose 4-epimerase